MKLFILFFLVSCSYKTVTYLSTRTVKGAEVTYFVCKKTTPIYSFGEKEIDMDFYGDDAEAKAMAACSK
jgi:hypothetical protein